MLNSTSNVNTGEENAIPKNQKTKKQTPKSALEQQLADCKATIQMLEAENRDFQNTVTLLRHNQKNEKTATQQNPTENLENAELKMSNSVFEEKNSEKMSNIYLNIIHRLELQEIKIKKGNYV